MASVNLNAVKPIINKLSHLKNREIKYHRMNGRYSNTIVEINPFINKLYWSGFNLLKHLTTYNFQGQNTGDIRSACFNISPMEIENRTISAIRLKGVYPLAKNNKVLPYTQGKGYCSAVYKVIDRDVVSKREKKIPREYYPAGTMSISRLEKEVRTALSLGPELTDMLLGFGIYEDIFFKNKPVGFAIYGMERKEDRRISDANSFDLIKCRSLFADAARKLRKVHEKGYVLYSRHLGNFGNIDNQSANILDLDAAIRLSTMPKKYRAAQIFLDLWITMENIYDLDTISRLNDLPASKALLPLFLASYFSDFKEQNFFNKLEAFESGKCTWDGYNSIFASMFTYSDCRYLYSSVLKPIKHLEKKSEVSLKDFYDINSFKYIYEAIKHVSQNIGKNLNNQQILLGTLLDSLSTG